MAPRWLALVQVGDCSPIEFLLVLPPFLLSYFGWTQLKCCCFEKMMIVFCVISWNWFKLLTNQTWNASFLNKDQNCFIRTKRWKWEFMTVMVWCCSTCVIAPFYNCTVVGWGKKRKKKRSDQNHARTEKRWISYVNSDRKLHNWNPVASMFSCIVIVLPDKNTVVRFHNIIP